jgi:DNA polymerase-4
MQRIIMHADLDAFYASVEQLDNPEYRGKPVVVGGPPESRGVVAAASYEARAFGIHSAMPMSRALRLCPDAVRVPPRFGRYGELSRTIMSMFRKLTPLIEPLSLDEAFLNVTAVAADIPHAETIARDLKRRVKEETGLTLSIGVASNKTVAKIASDMDKPDGLVVVQRGDEAAFLAPLPVRALWGIGPKTDAVLARAGIRTVADVVTRSQGELERLLGSRGPFLRDVALGIDDRPVETSYERKSVGAETTFARDLPDGPELREELRRIAEEVAHRLGGVNARAHTVALKLRYANFRTITRQASVKAPVGSVPQLIIIAEQLLDAVAQEGDRFRLLGISCSRLVDATTAPATLWDGVGHGSGTAHPHQGSPP